MTRLRASGSWIPAAAITARTAGRHARGPAEDQGCHAPIRIGRDQEHHYSRLNNDAPRPARLFQTATGATDPAVGNCRF
jgi:hypothetical protein